jgi:hypothetical protein
MTALGSRVSETAGHDAPKYANSASRHRTSKSRDGAYHGIEPTVCFGGLSWIGDSSGDTNPEESVGTV